MDEDNLQEKEGAVGKNLRIRSGPTHIRDVGNRDGCHDTHEECLKKEAKGVIFNVLGICNDQGADEEDYETYSQANNHGVLDSLIYSLFMRTHLMKMGKITL
jgi:hypothetical protein